MGNLTFLRLAERVIEEKKRQLSPQEFWNIAVSKSYDRDLKATGKTSSATLYSAMMTDALGQKSKFVKATEGPARYFLKRFAVASS